jgi:putative membrane-bound dehydrogenase-like protein
MPRFAAGLFVLVALAAAFAAPDAAISPDKAPAQMKLPEGFRVALFAGEPDVVKPIAMTTDDRGRVWVVESHSYPHWITDGKEGRDRVLIFTDNKGTGHFDSCKVFLDNGTNLSGIAVGHGGVWLCSTPNLLFIPVKDGEDRPAGKAVVALDGWNLKEAKHNVFNDLVWGPDSWLYGCNGIQSNSRVGKPGTPDKERLALNCGVWRYHPIKQRFEVVASGTTNPWGLDFDDYGEMFITNCVIKHLFHVVPGAHYQRMYGQDLTANCYGLMESCADHIHWAGGDWGSSRNGGAHSDAGGGHAHVGAMIYLGDNWPDEYRNHIFMCNLHGNRVNQDVLERHGSGYVAHHGKDFLLANDPWFRGLVLLYGPDGGVYIADWNDTGECHNYDKTTETNGRIYKVTYGEPAKVNVDLAKLTDDELVKLQLHKNDWQVRHARGLLQERAAAGKLGKGVRAQLLKLLSEQKEVPRKLRILWALHAVSGLDEKTLLTQLDSADDMVRVWSVRLLLEDTKASEAVATKLTQLATDDKSATVRLALASALQRLPLDHRWQIAKALGQHPEDAEDVNLPLMMWYGIEPLVSADPARAVGLLSTSCIGLVRQYIARRIATSADTPKSLALLVKLLAKSDDEDVPLDILRGMYEGLQGRKLDAPDAWPAVQRKFAASPNAEARQKTLMLSVMFGDKEALASLRKTIADIAAKDDARRLALQTLIEVRAPELDALLRDLLTDKVMRGPAVRGLAAYKDPEIPPLILKHYSTFTDAEKADAINTLASRIDYALVLLDAVDKNQVPRRDISAFTARQLLAYNNKGLTEKVNQVWGSLRPPAQEKTALLNRYKSLVPPDALKKADRSHGRAVFAKNCANCHTLFNEGGKIGPDLTGSQRANPDYILTKVLDPSAVVSRDYQMTILDLKNGRSISGLVKSETEKTVTMQAQNEVVLVNKTDIDERKKSSQSMMPDGLFTMLSDADVRDLMAYLAGAEQAPLPPMKPGSPSP